MKKLSLLVSIIMLLLLVISSIPQATALAADFTASVNISTASPKVIDIGMSGTHNENFNSVYRYDHPELIDRVNDYDRMGYIRINGTNLNVYNWKTGAVDEEYLGQYSFDEDHYYLYMDAGRVAETKGYERLADMREFLQRTGTKLILPVNVFENTIWEVGQLAKYCFDNHIPVLYFELGNEVSLFTAETGTTRSHRYKTGTDYLDRMISYNNQIKSNYPGARTVVAMSNNRKTVFDQDFKTFSPTYWDAVTFHRFKGDEDSVDDDFEEDFGEGMRTANDGLATWDSYIDHFLDNLQDSSTPIIIGEHSVGLGGILSHTQYNGIVVAESMLRLSKHPNVKFIQSFRIPGGIGNTVNNYDNELEDAHQQNMTIDTNTFNLQFYDSAAAVSARVVDGALNNSSAAWNTTLTGGTTVQRTNGTTTSNMPALYSQAYRGAGGKNYLVIVNKSASTHDVTVKVDNTNVNQAMTRTYVTAGNSAKNSASSTPVAIQTATVNAGDPVFIPAYSVTRVEWTRTSTPEKPPVPWLSHAEAGNNKVDLRWHRSINAAGYKIKYGTDPDNLTNEVDVGNVTSYSVTGLTNGTTYYFAVAAYNSSGTSLYSNSDQILPSGIVYNNVFVKLAAPTAPLIRQAHHETAKRAIVEWASVQGATGYKLKYGSTPGNYTNVIDVGNNVGYIVDRLTNEQPYYFAVSAYNGFGESANSAEETATPSGARPLAPHSLKITNETSTSVSLSWERTKAPRQFHYFELGNTNWNNVLGTWSVVAHPDSTRSTNVYKSPATGQAISSYENVSTGELEGDATIEVIGAYGSSSQVGIVSQYTNNNNYYRFVYDSADDKFKLYKRVGGTDTLLGQKARVDVKANLDPTNMLLRLDVKNGKIVAKYGSKAVINATDSSLSGGTFGLYTNNQEAYFDGVRLRKDIGTTFKVYRSESPHQNFTVVKSGVTGTSWTDNSPVASKHYFYKVTAVTGNGESYGFSNTIRKD
jgi:hypothetical protein